MPVPLIPRELLFGNPQRTRPEISPDGTRIAHLAPVDGVLNVWVAAVGGTAAPVTADTDRGIRSYFWAHDNRHLVYLQDTGGDENWRLFAVDLDVGGVRDLTPFAGVQATLLGLSRERPSELAVGLNREDPTLHDPHLLDLRDGSLTPLGRNPGFAPCLVDDDLAWRGGVRWLADGGAKVVVDDRVVLQLAPDDALETHPIGFGKDGSTLLLITPADAPAARLVSLELATGAVDVLAEDPVYDVSEVEVDPLTLAPRLVGFNRERLEQRPLDPALRGDVTAIEQLHRGNWRLVSCDHADRTWIVSHTVDDGPVTFHVYDRADRRGSFLFHHDDRLADVRLASMEPFQLRSRDGLDLHGYVTFPPGDSRERLPAVLLVHGGPWGRDTWGYDREPQWLANRGYLCVQINFRGSAGYGKAFMSAGDREWGGRMHDDLLDAVDHVVGQGWADPGRIAVMGGSYGGYAALVGAAFTPERFRCAIDLVGPSNLISLIETVPPYWNAFLAQFHRRVGDPATDADLLWSRSPLSRVDRISIPVLIAQGANDPRVKQAESEQIVAAMRARGIPHEYLLFADEGHGFTKPENALAFHAAAERFLSEHLGGRFEP